MAGSRKPADWHGWTWRNARRLAAARGEAEAHRLPQRLDEARQCDGRPFPPPPVTLEVPPKPLTARAER